MSAVRVGDMAAEVVCVGRDFSDARGPAAQRYDAQPGTVYLLRPDQHVAARWRSFDPARIRAALARACTPEGVSMSLQLQPNIPDPDGFYEELIGMQRDLDDEQATLFQARLLLVLANHVGDRAVLSQAMEVARPRGGPEGFVAGGRGLGPRLPR